MRAKMIGLLAAGIVLGAFLLGSTGAVRLAREETEASGTGSSRLIGALITEEHLDLFDAEGFLRDHAGVLLSGGEIAGETEAYEGRLYAELADKGRPEYVFPDVEGIRYFAAEMEDANGKYTQSVSDEGISDGHMAVNGSENGTSVSLEGTVYIAARRAVGTGMYFINPVYQEADGRVYAMSGNSISMDDGTGRAGEKMTVTLTESDSWAAGEESTSRESKVAISIAYMEPPERVTVVQMDGGNVPLAQEEYLPGETPEALTPLPEAAYLIIETEDAYGSSKRTLCQREDESFTTFASGPDGLCAERWTEIRWQ